MKVIILSVCLFGFTCNIKINKTKSNNFRKQSPPIIQEDTTLIDHNGGINYTKL